MAPVRPGRKSGVYVSRACEPCRRRKAKCSGEQPSCETCVKAAKACTYSTDIDGRATDSSAKERVEELQRELSALKRGAGMSHDPSSAPDVESAPPGWMPFQSGQLVLSPNGSLHLAPHATFYHPAFLSPPAAGTSASSTGHAPGGHLAPYLPFHMDKHDHDRILGYAHDCMLAFGMNCFKSTFMAAVERDVSATGPSSPYFSPVLHLCCLGVGWRYERNRGVHERYQWESGDAFETRGQIFIKRARQMVVDRSDSPDLAMIIALQMLALYHVGMVSDPTATVYLGMANWIARDFRLQLRCDAQLGLLGLGVDSELDRCRRDTWAFLHNFNAWWGTYHGQRVATFPDRVYQRTPIRCPRVTDEQGTLLADVAPHHSVLSDIGTAVLQCNHEAITPMPARLDRVKTLGVRLQDWEAELPENLKWNPRRLSPLIHPGIITTLGMYCSYIIVLYRPYIIDIGKIHNVLSDALGKCTAAAQDIVDMCRYIRDHHGIHTAPLSLQHVIYVAGTTLILQASGLPTISSDERTYAIANLAFLQRVLDEFAEVWPAAARTATSLRQLQSECVL